MTKRRVVFEVDSDMLFDRLLRVGGDVRGMGQRIFAAMIADLANADLSGLRDHGITLVSSERIDER